MKTWKIAAGGSTQAAVGYAYTERAQPAKAHSFYPWECYHDRDCWPMGTDADAKGPIPRLVGDVWILFDGNRRARRRDAHLAGRPLPRLPHRRPA